MNHPPEYYDLIEPYNSIKQVPNPIVNIHHNDDGSWTTMRQGPTIPLTLNSNPEFKTTITVTYEDGTTEQIKACDIEKVNHPIKSMVLKWD